jgi:tetratricopeptide (TPR) repeat protein
MRSTSILRALGVCLCIAISGSFIAARTGTDPNGVVPSEVERQADLLKSKDDVFSLQKSRAIQYAKAGKDDLVTESCNKLITDFGKRKDIAIALSQVADECRDADRHSPAIQLYQYLLAHWPDSNDAISQQASLILCQRCIRKNSEADTAMQKFAATYKDRPSFRQAAYTIGEGLRRRNINAPKAREAYAIAASGSPYPDMVRAKAGFAISCVRMMDYGAAAPVVQNMAVHDANDSRLGRALCDIADAFQAQHRRNEATQLYQYVIDHQPNDEYAMWSQKGLAAAAIDARDDQGAKDAIDTLKANYAKWPGYAAALSAVADNYRSRNQHAKARDLYMTAAVADPNDGGNLWRPAGLAISSIALDDPNAATAALTRLMSRYRDDPALSGALYEVGDAFSKAKQFDKAAHVFDQVVAALPDSNAVALSAIGLGLIQVRQGNEAAGDAIFRKVLTDYADNPGLPRAVLVFGQEYMERGLKLAAQAATTSGVKDEKKTLPENAQVQLKKALAAWAPLTSQTAPTDWQSAAEAQYHTAVVYSQLGEYQSALNESAKFLQQWPDYTDSWRAFPMMAKLYKEQIRAGSISQADGQAAIDQLYQQLLETNADCPGADQIRAALQKSKAAAATQSSKKGGRQ